MPQSNRWYPQLRSAGQDLISAIKGAFDRIYNAQDRIDHIEGVTLDIARKLANLDPSWTAYTPSITPKADMVITNLVIAAAFIERNKSVLLRIQIQGQLGSVATNSFIVTLPKSPVSAKQCLTCSIKTASDYIHASAVVQDGAITLVFDDTLIHASAAIEIVIGGVVEIK